MHSSTSTRLSLRPADHGHHEHAHANREGTAVVAVVIIARRPSYGTKPSRSPVTPFRHSPRGIDDTRFALVGLLATSTLCPASEFCCCKSKPFSPAQRRADERTDRKRAARTASRKTDALVSRVVDELAHQSEDTEEIRRVISLMNERLKPMEEQLGQHRDLDGPL